MTQRIVQIEAVDSNELAVKIAQELKAIMPSNTGDGFMNRVEKMLVNRRFIEMNFGWGRVKVEGFEASGDLFRQVNLQDTKTHYYYLGDVVRLYQKRNAT